MPKVLIIGQDGLIGSMMMRAFAARGWTIMGTTRRPDPAGRAIALDLADANSARTMPLPEADVVLLAAAMARFAECRAAPERARAVNVEAPLAIAERFAARGARSVLISTSAVFDGSRARVPAKSPTRPASDYGRLKAEAEQGILALGPWGAVVRLTKVLHAGHALFAGWRDALRRGEPIEAFADLSFAPIAATDVETGIMAAAA